MYSHNGKMVCSVTGTTIDPDGYEGYYIYTGKDGTVHHLCALAYALFDSVLQYSFNFENLPEEAQESFVWEFQGNENITLIGCAIPIKARRRKDRKKRLKKQAEEADKKWAEAKEMLKIALK
tara:strand:+ start:1558 stop:1923 length:366 start_codon:yes stop_codon:yes gene_type:complete